MSEKIKIGAINWDAFKSDDAYFSNHAIDSLGNEKHSSKLPFYIQKKDGKFIVPKRSVADYEKELSYAIECGIDFFAYCWYPDTEKEKRTIWHDNEIYNFLRDYYPELNYARKLYQQSELNKKIGMCAIIFCINSYAESDFDSLFDAMGKDYYVKVNNRPLLIIFDNYNAEFIDLVRSMAEERNINPYIAFINTGAVVDKSVDYTHADAVTAYGCGHSVNSFDEHTKKVNEDNAKRAECGVSVIPLLSAGWNPLPRIERPKPWVTYPDLPYAPAPNEDNFNGVFEALDEFVANCPGADTGLALTFAWNEFEEGGYLCPTLKADGTADESLIKAFANAKKKYTEGNEA